MSPGPQLRSPLRTQGHSLQADAPFSVPQVEVEVESMDKAGNFIGWLHIDGANLSVLLVEHALSKVHFTAERSSYYKSLLSAEEAAKQKKEKVWCGLGPGRGGRGAALYPGSYFLSSSPYTLTPLSPYNIPLLSPS